MHKDKLPLRGAWIEIDLDQLQHNVHSIRQLTGSKTLLMPVVKADAYGHGCVRCAPALVEAGADRFAVATLEEGVQLRETGVTTPIHCLGYLPPRQYPAALEYDIIFTVYELSQAVDISAAAVKSGRDATVHIKVDTGFTRLGFPVSEQAAEQIATISQLPGLRLEGVFSHFAAADFADKSFSEYQDQNFRTFLKLCGQKGVNFPIRHIANSAAILDMPQYNYELSRPGIILYGCRPSPEVKYPPNLSPVMSVKAEIARLMTVPADTFVGYGCTWQATRESTIATIPLGYADGFSRLFSNNGYVLVNGQRAPIVGRVCMDHIMIDVTDIRPSTPLHEGSIVTILGTDGKDSITADELAEKMGTINYEVLCLLGTRLPKVYLQNR